MEGEETEAEAASAPHPDALDGTGWVDNGKGDVVEGKPQAKDSCNFARFKHSQATPAGDVWTAQVDEVGHVDEVGQYPAIGFAGADYDPARYRETCNSTALVYLGDGSTCINSDLSLDGRKHYYPFHLGPHLPPKTGSFVVSLRTDPDGNVPQVQFNQDGVWHDFAPEGEGRVGLKAGPWFPYLQLGKRARLSDHRVRRPKPTKGAGMKCKAPAAAQADQAEGAGAGAGTE
jgi:hypothetical protein